MSTGVKHALLLPTRGRVEAAKRAVKSAIDTAKGPLWIYVRLDVDDKTAEDCFNELKSLIVSSKHTLKVKGGVRIAFGSVYGYNELAQLAALDGMDILHQIADDVEFITPGWDLKIQEYYKNTLDKKVLFFTQDNEKFDFQYDTTLDLIHIAHCIITKEWYDHFGYFFAPMYTHSFCDWELSYIARKSNRLIFVPDVMIKHYKGSMKDALYMEIRSSEWKVRDLFIYTHRFIEMFYYINHFKRSGAILNEKFTQKEQLPNEKYRVGKMKIEDRIDLKGYTGVDLARIKPFIDELYMEIDLGY